MGKFGGNDRDSAPTRIIRNSATRRLTGDEETMKVDSDYSDETVKLDSSDEATQKLDSTPSVDGGGFREVEGTPPVKDATGVPSGQPAFVQNESSDSSSPKTRLFRSSSTSASASSAADEPIVGWLVVVSGKGEGTALQFSYGKNSIGRDAGQDIVLDFGDEEVSRINHASIEYDPRGRQCYLYKGENLVYVNSDRLGQGAELQLNHGDSIELGKTILRFIPFCGPEFCWQAKD